MSQNQSYFWHTTRHNVYLKRSAKLQMLLALLAVLTFSTICSSEILPRNGEFNGVSPPSPTKIIIGDEQNNLFDAANGMKNNNNDDDLALKKDSGVQTGFLDGFTASISVILVTELGDKTFFIAAIMAMRHPRLIVFIGAITALALMTILSVFFGMLATIIPMRYTYYISTALFAIFGLKMLYDSYVMKDTDAQEELEEVQSDLRKREDELKRSTRSKFEETESKRKNSNSDKEDDLAGGENGAGASTMPIVLSNEVLPTVKYRKPTNNNNNNNNNHHHISGKNHNNNDCDIHNNKNVSKACENIIQNEHLHKPSSIYHSSPAISVSTLSQQTIETNLDGTPVMPKKQDLPNGDATAMVHSTTVPASMKMCAKQQNGNNLANNEHMVNSSNSIDTIGAAAGQQLVDELNVNGGTKRLERDVTSALVKDPESGMVRKKTKKGSAYLTLHVMLQAFTMTFLAEWGDRSQLTTILLAASKNVYGVIAGGIIGHSMCTGLAVVGGRIVATKISVRTVTVIGGIVFLGFALYALVFPPEFKD